MAYYGGFWGWGFYRNINSTIRSVARPDIRDYAKKVRGSAIACFIVMGAATLLFFLFMGLFFPLIEAAEFNYIGVFILFMIFLPLSMGLCGGLGGFFWMRGLFARELVSVLDQIENRDRILIKDIGFSYAQRDGDMVFVVRTLMEKGLLNTYEIIDDTLVAKKSLNLCQTKTENTARAEDPDGRRFGQAFFCTGCGSPISEADSFCAHCGREKKR